MVNITELNGTDCYGRSIERAGISVCLIWETGYWGVFTELCLTFFFEEKNYTCLLRYLPTVGQGWQGT